MAFFKLGDGHHRLGSQNYGMIGSDMGSQVDSASRFRMKTDRSHLEKLQRERGQSQPARTSGSDWEQF